MAFRQFGGLQFSSKQNYVSNQYNMTSNLGVPIQIGQAGSVIRFASDISGNLTVHGNVTANAFIQTSDYRIKYDVHPLTSQCCVDDLRPVEYMNQRTGMFEMGLIAHEVQEYFPHLVFGEKDDPETYQSVNYIGLIPVLIKEVQELKKELQTMREAINQSIKS